MATSYLGIENGRRVEKIAGTTGGATDANKMVAYDINGQLPVGAFPNGFGPDNNTFVASEALSSGAWVNIYSNAGVPTIRNATANAGAPLEAYGYVTNAVASGATGTVFFDDKNTGVSGQTIGQQWLSATTPGANTPTPPTGAGVYSQFLGVAISPTAIHASIERATILAQ